MKTITTKRISPTIPVELEPEIKAYIAKRVAEFKAKQKEVGHEKFKMAHGIDLK